MQRVYGVIDDETFHRMNKAVDETKSSRAQWIGEAIMRFSQRSVTNLKKAIYVVDVLKGENFIKYKVRIISAMMQPIFI
jgi:hypothetical protein